MKLCWIYVKSPTLLMKYREHTNFVLYDERPTGIIEYVQKNLDTMDYFITVSYTHLTLPTTPYV